MKLSDVMSAADLAGYAEIGLVIFLIAFVAVAVKVFWPGQTAHFERLGRIPLDDQPVSPRGPAAGVLTKETSK
jgi:cbb3-type cytochrome oxidase subunit 3